MNAKKYDESLHVMVGGTNEDLINSIQGKVDQKKIVLLQQNLEDDQHLRSLGVVPSLG